MTIEIAMKVDQEKHAMSGNMEAKESLHPEIKKALSECIQGARTAEVKALDYLARAQGETDDALYEACRSMHRFYATMHDFFLEEQRAIVALLEDQVCIPTRRSSAA